MAFKDFRSNIEELQGFSLPPSFLIFLERVFSLAIMVRLHQGRKCLNVCFRSVIVHHIGFDQAPSVCIPQIIYNIWIDKQLCELRGESRVWSVGEMHVSKKIFILIHMAACEPCDGFRICDFVLDQACSFYSLFALPCVSYCLYVIHSRLYTTHV